MLVIRNVKLNSALPVILGSGAEKLSEYIFLNSEILKIDCSA